MIKLQMKLSAETLGLLELYAEKLLSDATSIGINKSYLFKRAIKEVPVKNIDWKKVKNYNIGKVNNNYKKGLQTAMILENQVVDELEYLREEFKKEFETQRIYRPFVIKLIVKAAIIKLQGEMSKVLKIEEKLDNEFLIQNIRIDFFTTDKGLDVRAARGGVYGIELLKMRTDLSLPLYVGESVYIAKRCGEHLFSFFGNHKYFGLEKEDFENNELILRFSVLEKIDERKSILGVGRYKENELQHIQKLAPSTQLKTSDRQLGDLEEKVKKVQAEMVKKGFK